MYKCSTKPENAVYLKVIKKPRWITGENYTNIPKDFIIGSITWMRYDEGDIVGKEDKVLHIENNWHGNNYGADQFRVLSKAEEKDYLISIGKYKEKSKEKSLYRFKTKKEYIVDDNWFDQRNRPYGLSDNVVDCLGEVVPSEFNEICKKGRTITYKGWLFSNKNYTLISETGFKDYADEKITPEDKSYRYYKTIKTFKFFTPQGKEITIEPGYLTWVTAKDNLAPQMLDIEDSRFRYGGGFPRKFLMPITPTEYENRDVEKNNSKVSFPAFKREPLSFETLDVSDLGEPALRIASGDINLTHIANFNPVVNVNLPKVETDFTPMTNIN